MRFDFDSSQSGNEMDRLGPVHKEKGSAQRERECTKDNHQRMCTNGRVHKRERLLLIERVLVRITNFIF